MLTVATAGPSEVHVAVAVRSCELPSPNVPVAMNACFVPRAMDALSGVTASDTSAPEVTINVVEPCTPPRLAEMTAEPLPAPVANPPLPSPLLIVAVEGVSELHDALAVTSWVLPSVNVPVAVNCWFAPDVMAGNAGVIAMDTSAAGFTVRFVVPEIEPKAAVALVLPMATLLATP